jgi:hypothetical protein
MTFSAGAPHSDLGVHIPMHLGRSGALLRETRPAHATTDGKKRDYSELFSAANKHSPNTIFNFFMVRFPRTPFWPEPCSNFAVVRGNVVCGEANQQGV